MEVVFSWPGIGSALYHAVQQRDYPMLQGGFLIVTVSIIFFNFIADLLYFKLDPRVARMSSTVAASPPSARAGAHRTRATLALLRARRLGDRRPGHPARVRDPRVIAPWIAPYSTDVASGTVYAPAVGQALARHRRRRHRRAQPGPRRRPDLAAGRARPRPRSRWAIGGIVGVLSGYFGGWVDMVLMRITDYFLVIPDLVLMIVVATLWGPSLSHVILVIGLLLWTSTARIVRARSRACEERRLRPPRPHDRRRPPLDHLSATSCPQIAPLLIANTVLSVAIAIFDETSLDFLGLGDPNGVSWGIILEHANDRTAVELRRVVGRRAGRALHRAGDRRLLPARAGARGRAQPAPARLPLLGHAAGGCARWSGGGRTR